jgi:hypothetical protein
MFLARRRCRKLVGKTIAVWQGEKLIAYGKVTRTDDGALYVETAKRDKIFETLVLYGDITKLQHDRIYIKEVLG